MKRLAMVLMLGMMTQEAKSLEHQKITSQRMIWPPGRIVWLEISAPEMSYDALITNNNHNLFVPGQKAIYLNRGDRRVFTFEQIRKIWGNEIGEEGWLFQCTFVQCDVWIER